MFSDTIIREYIKKYVSDPNSRRSVIGLKRHKPFCKYCIFLSIIFILLVFCRENIYAADNKKNILILNSYQEGLSWTQGENDGIIHIIRNSDISPYISVEYMDWKSYPSQENLINLEAYLKYKYEKKQIDLIVTTDDAALNFALNNRKELFSDAPVVFCGVNNSGVETLTKDKEAVTGVVEEIDPEGTIKAALDIYPDLKEIYVVFDNTESGASTYGLTLRAAQKIAPQVNVVPLHNGSYADILNKVGQAPPNSIIIFTTYYKDSEGIVIGFEESCKLASQKSPVPVFHLYDFGLGNGAVGGSVVSGRIQGELAAKMALRILKGEKISQIPVQTTKTTQYMFDYQQMERFKIGMDQIPKGSMIINNKFSFFQTYKNLVITVAIIIALLIIFIGVLLFYLNKLNKIKLELFKSNTELSRLYEDLTASDEELKQQFDELTELQQNLMSSEERYELLFEKMLNGFFVFEPVKDKESRMIDIRFIAVNPGFELQTQRKVYDLPGRTWTEVFGFKIKDLPIYQRVVKTGETERFETYYPESNIYYLVNAFRIKEDRVGVIFENITNYKTAIKQVRQLNEGLEQRVAERTNELQSVVSQLEAFTYTVSHDLKAPLRAVDSYSRIVLEDYGKVMDKNAVEMLSYIRTICANMIEMISKLLEYSMTSRSSMKLEEIVTEEIVVSTFHEIKAAFPGRNIELTIETGLPNIQADRVLFKQAMTNILSNAVKFTKDREYAHIRVGSTLTDSEYIFYIKDNGVGFDMNYSAKLFGIFQRLHTSDEFEGSGIGLVTIKKIIEKHGGKTWIEGEVGIGATIYFTIPFTLY